MASTNVRWIKTTQAKFETITPDNSTFYRVVQTDGSEDVYVGAIRLDDIKSINEVSEELLAHIDDLTAHITSTDRQKINDAVTVSYSADETLLFEQ